MSSSMFAETGDNRAPPTTERDRRSREYDRLRTRAREEADKRGEFFKLSRQAFDRGDRAGASQLSKEGKKHGKQMTRYNKRAQRCIFKLNNEKQPTTTIDLHGLFVKEAETYLLKRMNEVKALGEERINVIVGKGIHAVNGPKIKPAVEKFCRARGLTYSYQRNNEGMMVILLEDYEVEAIADTEASDMDVGDASDSGEEEGYPSTQDTPPSSPHPAIQREPQASPPSLTIQTEPQALPPTPRPAVRVEPQILPLFRPVVRIEPEVPSSPFHPTTQTKSQAPPPPPPPTPKTPPSYNRPFVTKQPYISPPVTKQPYTPTVHQYYTQPTTSSYYTRPSAPSQPETRPLLFHQDRILSPKPPRPTYQSVNNIRFQPDINWAERGGTNVQIERADCVGFFNFLLAVGAIALFIYVLTW